MWVTVLGCIADTVEVRRGGTDRVGREAYKYKFKKANLCINAEMGQKNEQIQGNNYEGVCQLWKM